MKCKSSDRSCLFILSLFEKLCNGGNLFLIYEIYEYHYIQICKLRLAQVFVVHPTLMFDLNIESSNG